MFIDDCGVNRYEIDNSLRFRASASAYLSRTPGSAGNRKTWTWSGWVKRGSLAAGSAHYLFSVDTAPYAACYFDSDTIRFYVSNAGVTAQEFFTSSAVFRDPSAWYHVVFILDTTQATHANRVKIYVNRTLLVGTWTNANTLITLNSDQQVNTTQTHSIGKFLGGYLDGYLSEVNFIDGQALDPTSFGEYDAVTGVWVPKKYTGTYGTNGFYLPFNDATSLSTLTADASGNGNNWTANNISLTAGVTYDHMEDTPTNNFAVLNPLAKGADATITEGNLTIAYGSSATVSPTTGTFGMTSGKWYWEVVTTAQTANTQMIGISSRSAPSDLGSSPGDNAFAWIYYGATGNKYNNASSVAYGASYTTNDIIGIAFDADAGTLTFYKNNASQGTAYTGLTSGPYVPVFGDGSVANTFTLACNFGQRPFAYTPPTGFQALCTKNTGAITPISSGTFTGNLNADGPFVWLAGTPNSMTINGNAVTWGTHADKLANGFKVRTSSSSYNASGSNTFSVASFVDDFTDPNRAKANP